MQKLVNLIPAISLAVAMFAAQPVAASDASAVDHEQQRVVGTIRGGGTSNMTDVVAKGLKGLSVFAIQATLFSDGAARGFFDCLDTPGDPPGYPGNISGPITSWSKNADGTVNLQVTNATLVDIPSGNVTRGLAFTVTIQHFGGAGVGHWTLDAPGLRSPFNGGPICQELLTSGRIVARWRS